MSSTAIIEHFRNPNVIDPSWIPSFYLSDGTALQGPWRSEPMYREAFAKVEVDGISWWFSHAKEIVNRGLFDEIAHWIRMSDRCPEKIEELR